MSSKDLMKSVIFHNNPNKLNTGVYFYTSSVEADKVALKLNGEVNGIEVSRGLDGEHLKYAESCGITVLYYIRMGLGLVLTSHSIKGVVNDGT